MSKTEPKVQKYMTCQPNAIEASETLSEAQRMMGELNIRHLPVMNEGKIYGVISDRDVKMAAGIVGASAESLIIADVCHVDPYCVHPDTDLHEVVDEMAVHHYGCAIVVQNDKLVGIFTTVDVCRALSDILGQRFHTH